MYWTVIRVLTVLGCLEFWVFIAKLLGLVESSWRQIALWSVLTFLFCVAFMGLMRWRWGSVGSRIRYSELYGHSGEWGNR
jgi:hypothetical protein